MEENVSGDIIELEGFGDREPETQPMEYEDDSYYVSRREWEHKNKTRKITVVVAYAAAVLFLLLGLFLPLFAGNKIMFQYLMVFLHGVFPSVQVPTSGWFAVSSAGLWSFPGSFDFISFIDLLLILTTIVSIFMLIPVIICKKEGNAYKNCALIVEIIAISLMGLHLVFKATYKVTLAYTDHSIFIALCFTMVAAVIQSVATKGSLGVFRLVTLLFSFLALLTWIGYITLVPSMKLTALANGLDANNAGIFAQLIEEGGDAIGEAACPGVLGIDMLVRSSEYNIFGNGTHMGVTNVFLIILSLLMILNFICDTAELNLGAKFRKDYNAAGNVMCNALLLMRYVLSFLVACTVLICCLTSDSLICGIYLYILIFLLLIGLVIAIIRTVMDSVRVKRGIVAPANMRVALYDPNFNKEKEEEPEVLPEPLPEPEPEPETLTIIQQQPQEPVGPQIQIYDYTSDYYEQEPQPYILPVVAQPEYEEEEPEPEPEPIVIFPEPEPEPEPEPKPHEYPDGYDSTPFMDYTDEEKKKPEEVKVVEEPQPETVYVYTGETDEFIETLDNNEKIEFYDIFIRKSKGDVKGVPDYVFHEKNEDFFRAVFVHLNRFRVGTSNGLLNKMYRQLGKVSTEK